MQIIIRLILVLCLVVAGIYGFVYYKTKTIVDDAIRNVSPYLEITYQGINNPMDGSVALTDIEIMPSAVLAPYFPAGEAEVTIESIEFRINSVLDFIFLKGKIENIMQEIYGSKEQKMDPLEVVPKIQLKINHIRFDSNLVAEANKKQKKSQLEHMGAQVLALGCGDIKSLYFLDTFQKLGITEYDISIDLDYEYEKYASVIDMKYEYTQHNVTNIFIKSTISGIDSFMSLMTDQKNLLTKFIFGYQDLGFNKKLNDFCAKEEGIKPENYIDYKMGLLKNYLSQKNITLSDDIYNAIKAMHNQSKITIKLMPENIASVQMIKRYKPSSWPGVLGMTVEVDGKEVNDLSMDWDKDTVLKDSLEAKSLDEKTKQQTLNGTDSTKKKNIKKKKKKRSYIEVSIPELKNYVNSYAKIILKSGKKFKGLIVGDEKNSITLKVKTQGGSIEMQMNYEKIKKASIYK